MRPLIQFTAGVARLLFRNRPHMVGSLGVGLLSILIFGALFGQGGGFNLTVGVVRTDNGALSAAIADALAAPEQERTVTGSEDHLKDQLRAGKLHAVVVLPAGLEESLAAAGQVQLHGYYDQTRPTEAGAAQALINAVVAEAAFGLMGGRPISVRMEGITAATVRQVDWLTPSLLGMMLMWANLYTGVYLVDWRERGILRRFAITPLRPWQVLSGQMAAQVLLSLAQVAVFLAVARLVFGALPRGSYLHLGILVLTGSLTMIAFGYLPGSLVRRSQGASSLTMLIAFPMMFLGESYFPIDGAPVWMQWIGRVTPLYHLNHALRSVWLDGAALSALALPLAVLGAWWLGAMLVSARIFRWS